MKLTLSNTLGRTKEIFTSLQDRKVKIYVCGITPYDYTHVGHGRCYVTFDLLVRVLGMLSYDVTYVRNFTDIDDKLLAKAKKEGDEFAWKQIAERYEQHFTDDMQMLNCLTPDVEPKVTEHIDDIIHLINTLVTQKKAYIVDHDVYFDISSFPSYGKLSGRKIEELKMGARVAVEKKKKHPADFALWKGNDEEMFWQSPWGYGRPGWHIECSLLAQKYLGEIIDIHAGGMDLIFPHHENEIAQSESLTGKPFARFWVHNAFITLDKEKMSKSLGNIITLKDIFTKYDPMVLRLFFLQHHYTSPIDFNFDKLEAAKRAYKKLLAVFADVQPRETGELELIMHEMLVALCDDLNTPKLLGILFEHLDDIGTSEELTAQVKWFLQQVTGLTFAPFKEVIPKMTSEIAELIKQRQEARKAEDWAQADAIRDRLRELGFDVRDEKAK